MAQYLPLPNGQYFEIRAGETPEQALAAAVEKYPDAFGLGKKETGQKKGITGAFGKGIESLLSSTRTAGQALVSPEEAAQAGLARQEDISRRYADEIGFDKAKQVYEQQGLLAAAKEVASQIPKAIAEQAPNIAATLGSARAGAALGSLAGPVGTVVGGVAGAALPTLVSQFGSNIERQAQEGQPINRGAAAAAAVPQAALDVAGTLIPLGGRLVSKLTGIPEKALALGTGNAAKLAEERLATTLAKGTAIGAVAEIPTEVAQQMLERLQAGLPLTSQDALAEYGQTAYQVGLLAPIGAAGRVSERGAARLEVQRQKEEEARKAAAEAEAAKNQPDALRQLDDQFRAAQQQLETLNAQVDAAKPKKGAPEEAKAAYEQAKADRANFINTEYKPLKLEFDKRKGAIEQMYATQQSQMETAEAPEQAAAKLPLPSDVPGAQPFQLSDTAKLMDEYDNLRTQVGALEDKLAAGPDIDTQAQLTQQRGQLMARMQEMAPIIEERGGVTDTEAEHAKKVAAAEKERLKLLEQGDFDAAAKQAEKVKALQTRTPFLDELKAYRATPAGGTREMFATEPTQPEGEGIKYVSPEGKPVEPFAATAAEAAPLAKAAPKEVLKAEELQSKVATAQTGVDEAVKTKDTAKLYAAIDELNQAEDAAKRAREATGGKGLKPTVIDIFDPSNLIRTAYENGDTKLINDIAAHAERTALRSALDQTTSEREKLIRALEGRADSPGLKRERADLFSKLYNTKQQALFKNGTYPDRELQALYDKGGPAAVEYEYVMKQVEPLMKKVTTKQGNAKESLYEQLIRTYAELEALNAQMESGVATPTMREKTAGLQAKLGKGEAPAQRPMNEAEKYQLQRKITSTTNKYNMLVGKITPIRDEILKLHDSLYTTTKVEKPSVLAEKKAKEAETAARTQAKAVQAGEAKVPKSRAAQTAARINAGDVRREAETSQKMRDLARELGEREPEYEKFNEQLTRRLEALKKKYGPDDRAVNAFRITMGQERINKAEELGKKTPEYKATLKEQIAYFQDTLAQVNYTVGKQEAPSKRTGPVTRKQSGAPKTLRVAGSRMTEREIEQEIAEGTAAEKKRSLRGVETESVALDGTTVSLLKQNDVRSALARIGADSRVDEFSRTVAKTLKTFLDATKIKLVDDLRDPEGREVLGAATSKLIELNTNGGLSVETLLHEATHAAAERVVQLAETNPDALTREQKLAINELKALHARIKADPDITSKNAKGSLSEFVAEVMSNRNLQKQLAKKPWRLSNMWDGIKSVIMRMLGVQKVETMFGASAVAVEQLFVPSSVRVKGGQPETKVTRKLSAKDIAALHDGSNSMKQFADQFGPLIKQKDRTPEDVERIANEAIQDMGKDLDKTLALPTKDTLDYKALATMSDGTLYDNDNPLHFIEAEPATHAAVEALENPRLREEEARAIAKQRKDDFLSLVQYFSDNYNNYTAAEMALVLKAASKYAVLSGKDGRLRLAELAANNRHNVAVVGKEGADAVIEQLRAGKNLKQAFLDGLQKAADESAKQNARLNGWKKFDQADKDNAEQAAIDLNAGCAGTSWCTGASVQTARGQIEGGDFYVYYKDGKPEVAVRMRGKDDIGEIRGNTPAQALTVEQRDIAKAFLRSNTFKGTDNYIKEMDNRELLKKLFSDPNFDDYKQLTSLGEIVRRGQLNGYRVRELLDFSRMGGYRRAQASDAVYEALEQKLKTLVHKAFADNNFIGEDVSFDSDQETVDLEFDGKKYVADVKTIESANKVKFQLGFDKTVSAPNLRRANTVWVHPGVVKAPKLESIKELTLFGSSRYPTDFTVSPDAVIETADFYGVDGSVVLHGAKTISAFEEPTGDVNVYLPDVRFLQVKDLQGDTLLSDTRYKLGDYLRTTIRDADEEVGYGVLRMPLTDLSNSAKKAFKKGMQDIAALFDMRNYNIFGADYVENDSTPLSLLTSFLDEHAGDYVRADMLAFNRKANQQLGLTRADALIEKAGVVQAPNKVAATPYGQELEEEPEERRFAPKDIGVQGDAKSGFSFLRKKAKVESVVGREPGVVDNLLGNMMGLAGRVQFIDQYAALEAATKKGLSAGVISSLEATNANYLLRFGQQRSQFAGQFLTNGPVKAEHTKKDGGVETVYRSTKGTSMVDVANALNKAKIADDVEQENMFTLYLAGKRANQVGWNKLNFKDPGKAQAEYADVMARLDGNAQAKAAFEEAAKLYQQYNAGLLDFLVDTGALSSNKAAELKAISYVPFYRINDNGEVQLMIDKETPVRISNIKDQPQLKELVGGNTAILPVFTSAAQNTFMLTGMGLRNQAVKETSFMLQKMGIASVVREGKGPQGSNVVRFFKNGKQYYALIDTDMYGVPAELIVRGMEGIKTTLPAVIKAMAIPANILRSFVVRNPAYAVRQVIRDPLNAWLTTGTDATPVLSSMKELASMVAGRSEAERKLMETGAISSNVFSGDEQDMAKFLKDLSAGKSMWDKALAKLDAFALQGDAATRAVIYKDSLAKGMTEQEALLRTLESMNFSRRGVSPSMQALSVMIPFFNAQVQGLDVIYRAFKGDMPYSEQLKIKEKLIQRGLMLAAGTLAYAAMMEDDEAYKRARPEERYANWFVHVPGFDEPVRVPIPFEMGFLFKALPEAVWNVAMQDDKAEKAMSGLFKLAQQTNPFSLPQAVKPLTEAVLGKSFYGGDIESAREKGELATERYRENSTELAKTIGAVTGKVGISPITIDYLIRGYTGGLGIALVQLANPLLATDTRAEVAEPTTKISKQPFIGGLFQPVEGRGTLDEAYDRMQEIQQTKGTFNKLIEQGKRAEAMQFAQEYSDKLAAMSVSGAVQKRLGELAKVERQIRAAPNLTTEQKDARLEQLDKAKMAIARQFLAVSDRTTPR